MLCLKAHVRATVIQTEKVWAWSYHGDETHHERFANRIDRWVRDLSESLPKVLIKNLGPVRHYRDRRIIAHRPDRVYPIQCHRADHQSDGFLRVAEGLLPIEE